MIFPEYNFLKEEDDFNSYAESSAGVAKQAVLQKFICTVFLPG